MIQFNLLPDVKLEFIKAQRKKRTIISIAVLVAGVSLGIFVLSFMAVNVAQKQHLGNLQKDIDKSNRTLKENDNLAKIVTIQNQLKSLPGIHAQKPVVSRVFGYIQQVTPEKASVSSLKINYVDQTIEIEGSADSLVTVNTFADTLKFTNYTAAPAVSADEQNAQTELAASDPKLAFNSVVLDTFTVVSEGTVTDATKQTTFVIKLKFDPTIFGVDNVINLLVEKSRVTTRSETQKPDTIFQEKETEVDGEQ